MPTAKDRTCSWMKAETGHSWCTRRRVKKRAGKIPAFDPKTDSEGGGHSRPVKRKRRNPGRWQDGQQFRRHRETTTGVTACRRMKAGHAALSRDQRQRFVTKSKFDNIYGCALLRDGLNRARSVIAGQAAVRVRVWRSPAGVAQALKGQGAQCCHRDRSICALQAAMELAGTSRSRTCSRRLTYHTRRATSTSHRTTHGGIGQGNCREHRPSTTRSTWWTEEEEGVKRKLKPQSTSMYSRGQSICSAEGRS